MIIVLQKAWLWDDKGDARSVALRWSSCCKGHGPEMTRVMKEAWPWNDQRASRSVTLRWSTCCKKRGPEVISMMRGAWLCDSQRAARSWPYKGLALWWSACTSSDIRRP